VTTRKWMAGAAIALVATMALVVTSLGAAKPAKSNAPYQVALVTDIGGLNDKGFNQLAYRGLLRSQKTLGVKGRVFISKSAADYIPNLTAAVKQGNQLVIAVGFLMADSIAAIAKKFPGTKFAIVDFPAPFLKGAPKNARGIVFAENEAGCLAGVAAAKVTKDLAISSVGGVKIPPVDAFIAGYQHCAKLINKRISTLNDYSQDFVAQDKCKELALIQIEAGSDVVFQVAGNCGLGALAAAKEKKVWGIGVDNDQGFVGRHVLTSATKKVDVGVFSTIALAKSNKFKGGADGVFNVKNGGTGYGKVSLNAPNRKGLIKTLNLWAAKIKTGKVKIPATLE
jgi:basic membrane protein A